MAALSHRQPPPSAAEVEAARTAGRRLARHVRRTALTVRVIDAEQDEPIELPAGAVAMLMDVLEAMASGRGVTLIPENAELTTVQAAALLNVSRPYLIKLLEAGAIPHRKVGKHRRVMMEDVMSYKNQIDGKRSAVLDELVADAQTLGMGYEIE